MDLILMSLIWRVSELERQVKELLSKAEPTKTEPEPTPKKKGKPKNAKS